LIEGVVIIIVDCHACRGVLFAFLFFLDPQRLDLHMCKAVVRVGDSSAGMGGQGPGVGVLD